MQLNKQMSSEKKIFFSDPLSKIDVPYLSDLPMKRDTDFGQEMFQIFAIKALAYTRLHFLQTFDTVIARLREVKMRVSFLI